MQREHDDIDYMIYDNIPEVNASMDYNKKLFEKLNKKEKKRSISLPDFLSDISGTKKIAMSFIMAGIFLFLFSQPYVQYYAVNINYKVKSVQSKIYYGNEKLNFMKQIKNYLGE